MQVCDWYAIGVASSIAGKGPHHAGFKMQENEKNLENIKHNSDQPVLVLSDRILC